MLFCIYDKNSNIQEFYLRDIHRIHSTYLYVLFFFFLLEEGCEEGKVNVHHRNNAPDLLLTVVYTFTWIEQESVPPDTSSLFLLL